MSKGFVAAQDPNRKRIRGFWKYGDKYFLQVKVAREKTPRKLPFEAVSLSEAKSAMEAKRTELRVGNGVIRGRKPRFADRAEN